MASDSKVNVKGNSCKSLSNKKYFNSLLLHLAILDYDDYEKMKTKKSSKKEGLLKNPVVQDKIIPDVFEPKDLYEEQVAVSNANKDFNVKTPEEEKEAEIVKVVPKTSVNSDTATFPNVETVDLTKNVSENNMKNAKKLLEKIDLANYRGGVVTIDGETYDYPTLSQIMEILYGKTKKLHQMKLSGQSLTFLKSLQERNLKKYVKNKNVFKFVKSPYEWWNLNNNA